MSGSVIEGILPSQDIRALHESGAIKADRPLVDGQIQPASLDLRLGRRVWRLRASFLPGQSHKVRERLDRELKSNVALRVAPTDDDTIFEVSGRGELHLTILLENMRREGYELAVSRPRVVFHDVDGEKQEPMELLSVDVEDSHQGGVMQELGLRKGELLDMQPDGRGRVRLEYRVPARGLIGFQGEFLNLTRGTGLMSHIFDGYENFKGEIGGRKNGVLISMDDGEIVTYAAQPKPDRKPWKKRPTVQDEVFASEVRKIADLKAKTSAEATAQDA